MISSVRLTRRRVGAVLCKIFKLRFLPIVQKLQSKGAVEILSHSVCNFSQTFAANNNNYCYQLKIEVFIHTQNCQTHHQYSPGGTIQRFRLASDVVTQYFINVELCWQNVKLFLARYCFLVIQQNQFQLV